MITPKLVIPCLPFVMVSFCDAGDPACDLTASFQSQLFDAGNNPRDLLVGDFNADGINDAVVANLTSDGLSLLTGTGDGRFAEPSFFSLGDGPVSIAADDLNGDGILDIVATNIFSNSVSVLIGHGDGMFTHMPEIPTGAAPLDVEIGDIDNDGTPDLLITNRSINRVTVLAGVGDGTFIESGITAIGSIPLDSVLTDINNDGNLDVATVFRFSDTIEIRPGLGDGTFGGVQSIEGIDSKYIWAEDLNGDGSADLVTGSNDTQSSATILYNDGSGGFLPPVTLNDILMPNGIAIGDCNGDGVLDLAVLSRDERRIGIYLGDASGSFTIGMTYPTGADPLAVHLGRFNDDGALDIVFIDSEADTIRSVPGRGDGTFSWHSSHADIYAYSNMIAEDLNGDGTIDLLAAARNSDEIYTYLGRGDGIFERFSEFERLTNVDVFQHVDLNGDGIKDIIYNSRTPIDAFYISFGIGDGSFETTATSYSIPWHPAEMLIADIDADGDPDVLNSIPLFDEVSINLNNGDGTFADSFILPDTQNMIGYTVIDTMLDGVPEILISVVNDNTILSFERNNDGTYTQSVLIDEGYIPQNYRIYDFNNDGYPDIAYSDTEFSLDYFSVRINQTDGTFADPIRTDMTQLSVDRFPNVFDMNLDGVLDLVYIRGSSITSSEVFYMVGTGDGGFTQPTQLAGGFDQAESLGIADFDNDGDVDLAVGDSRLHELFIVLSSCVTQPLCPADLNGDGTLNFFDVSAFLSAFQSQNPIADFNGDGLFNFFDVSAYLIAYNVGCT